MLQAIINQHLCNLAVASWRWGVSLEYAADAALIWNLLLLVRCAESAPGCEMRLDFTDWRLSAALHRWRPHLSILVHAKGVRYEHDEQCKAVFVCLLKNKVIAAGEPSQRGWTIGIKSRTAQQLYWTQFQVQDSDCVGVNSECLLPHGTWESLSPASIRATRLVVNGSWYLWFGKPSAILISTRWLWLRSRSLCSELFRTICKEAAMESSSHVTSAKTDDIKVPEQPEGLDNDLIELLIDGARYNDAEDVMRALSGQVDVNASDEAGRTGATTSPAAAMQDFLPYYSRAAGWAGLVFAALHMAAANGHSDVIKILLVAGAVRVCLTCSCKVRYPAILLATAPCSCKLAWAGFLYLAGADNIMLAVVSLKSSMLLYVGSRNEEWGRQHTTTLCLPEWACSHSQTAHDGWCQRIRAEQVQFMLSASALIF